MKHIAIAGLIATLASYSSFTYSQEIEIGVPNGWSANEAGIVKGNNQLSIGPVLDLGELSLQGYLGKLSNELTDDMEITSISELKDGKIVVQVTREVIKDGGKARSTLFICKKSKNNHRLLELYTDDVFALISGGKAAISFCDQV